MTTNRRHWECAVTFGLNRKACARAVSLCDSLAGYYGILLFPSLLGALSFHFVRSFLR